MNSQVSSAALPVGGFGGQSKPLNADRFGVFASVLCAIHCAVTPFFLLLLPSFGKMWAHPATHWGMAIIIVPIAALMMSKGYRRHRRAWVIVIGALGILFVLAGAVAPYMEKSSEPMSATAIVASSSDQKVSNTTQATQCSDACCPSLVPDESGSMKLEVPTASILTTVGGVFLIATHLGNLCCCRSCRRKTQA